MIDRLLRKLAFISNRPPVACSVVYALSHQLMSLFPFGRIWRLPRSCDTPPSGRQILRSTMALLDNLSKRTTSTDDVVEVECPKLSAPLSSNVITSVSLSWCIHCASCCREKLKPSVMNVEFVPPRRQRILPSFPDILQIAFVKRADIIWSPSSSLFTELTWLHIFSKAVEENENSLGLQPVPARGSAFVILKDSRAL